MNTEITWMFRDAANWKTHSTEVLAGALTHEQRALIEPYVETGLYFLPLQVGLDALQDQLGIDRDSHIWHEITEVTETDREPTVELTAAQFAEAFRDVVWNEDAAMLSLYGNLEGRITR